MIEALVDLESDGEVDRVANVLALDQRRLRTGQPLDEQFTERLVGRSAHGPPSEHRQASRMYSVQRAAGCYSAQPRAFHGYGNRLLGVALTTRPATWWVLHHSTTQRLSPLRGSKRLHQFSKRGADSREFWALAGVQALGGFMKYDADLRRKASVYKGLLKSASYCFQQ